LLLEGQWQRGQEAAQPVESLTLAAAACALVYEMNFRVRAIT